MSRTRLRGVELAGTRIAVEVPTSIEGSWPAMRHEAFECSPEGADVYVAARVGKPLDVPLEAFVYESESHRFEIAERGEDWIVAVYGANGLERTALFDDAFSEGEVVVSDAAASDGVNPLEHPLDELLLLHRIVRAGGLVLRGSVVLRDDRALLFLGGARPPGAPTPGRDRVTRLAGQRVVVLPAVDDVRAVGSPWTGAIELPATFSARLDALHSIRAARAVFADRLDSDGALEEVLAHALAPIHDPYCADRCFEAAAGIIERVPVLRLGLPEEKRVVPFTWGRSDTALAFAPPFVT
jgi:hypothetical protein